MTNIAFKKKSKKSIYNFLNYIKKKTKSICIFITDSIGELDYLIPLISNILNSNPQIKIKIVFLRPDIYKLFLENYVIYSLSKKMGIEIIHKVNSYKNNKLNLLKNLILNIDNIAKSFFDPNCLIMLESSGANKFSYIFDTLSKIFKKEFVLYPHTTALFHSKSISKVANSSNKTLNNHNFIINDFMEYDYYKNIRKIKGKAMHVAFPLKCKSWKKLIYSNFPSPIKKNYIVIFLNGLRTKYFEASDYEKLLSNFLNICSIHLPLKKMQILIKRHPRKYRDDEEKDIINKIKKQFKNLNLSIVNYSNYILSYYSKYNFCLNSNSVFLADAMNRNTIFYYIDDNTYKSCFPNGRSCIYFNIKNTNRENRIINIVKNL